MENGALKQTVEYIKSSRHGDALSKQEPSGNLTDKKRVLFQVNNFGQVMVKDGNGHAIDEFVKGVPESIEEGNYKGGYKDGVWTAKNPKKDFWYKEQYDQGELLSGESFKDGISYTYTEVESQPAFKGGMNGFYKYLGKTVRYPSDAVKSKTQGRVYLRFVVEKDGSITEVVVTKSVSPSIDAESRRVLEQSPAWIPGKQHGVPVRVLYRIPLTLALTRDG